MSREEGRPPALVLASASPRRAEVLAQLGLVATVEPADVDESPGAGESPGALVERLARSKAGAVAARRPEAVVVGGDTVVVHDGHVLGKPSDEAEARAMLRALSGTTHEVLSGVAVVSDGTVVSGVERTEVVMRPFDEAEAAAYAATGEPFDKAGAYGIQGMGAALVREIRGDYYAVMGFPVVRFLDLLRRSGWIYRFPALRPVDPSLRQESRS